MYMYTCIYTYIYIHMHMYRYMYTHILLHIYMHIHVTCDVLHLCCSRRSNKSMQSLSPRAHTLGSATSAAPRTYPWGCSRHAQSAEMASKEPFSISPRFALIKTCLKQVCCRFVAVCCSVLPGSKPATNKLCYKLQRIPVCL